MRLFAVLITSLFIWAIQSCKEVLPARVAIVSVDSTYTIASLPPAQSRVVLLEEYTGASCVNCPDGHRIVKEILTQFGSRVAAVGLHPKGNVLAKPVEEGNPDLDFTTEEARLLANTFLVSSLPSGTIDRKQFDGSIVQGRFELKQRVESVINSDVKVNVKSRVYFDNKAGKSVLEIECTMLEDIAEDLNFSIMLIENKLDAPQKSGSIVLDPYEHEHVLRKMLTNALGNSLKKATEDGGGYKKGRVFLKRIELEDFSLTKYKAENLYLVSFISNASTNEVMQTSQTKVKN
ncbi:MAG: Omp28-related outer membrane protein [Chitinophagales bacterium]|jgi:hypothetical protein|nr:Omp28-related outer membrane protein [Sphingobacteriales bacterium]